MCTVLLPPGDNPIAVNKYIIYHVYHIHTSNSYPFVKFQYDMYQCEVYSE